MSHGARMVRSVNPESRSVEVYKPGERSQTFTESDTLNGLDILPVFTYPLADTYAF